MSISPWKPDYPLTPATAAGIIATRFPDIDAEALRALGSGWHFDVFLTTDDWVFRFPRHGWCADLFDAEASAHRLVAGRLPSNISVPRVERVGAPALGYPYRFAGHRFISGVPADSVPASLFPAVGREIATLLGALHSIPESAARAAGIRESDPNEEGAREWVEHGVAVVQQLKGIDPVVDRAATWLSEIPLSAEPWGGRLQPVHGDLSTENILVNPNAGTLTGILDWTGMTLGDAARDFVFVAAWQGWPFVEQVLMHYPLRVDDRFRTRLRTMSQTLATIHLAYAYEAGSDLTPHVQAVRNVFAPATA